jgi:hypothetical protein
MTAGTGTPFFDSNQSGVGRAAVKGTIIATVAIWSFVTLVALWAGAHVAESLAMGGCAAFFGGPGFGGMFGAVLYLERQTAAQAAEVRPDDGTATPTTTATVVAPVAPTLGPPAAEPLPASPLAPLADRSPASEPLHRVS